jgi:23S rRNA (guanosine2251-2'-O)-methyltransferase
MPETIYGRNAVYECLRAKRRQLFDLQILDSAKPSPKLDEILRLADARRVPVKRVHRLKSDDPLLHPQGVMLGVGPYPYVDLADILELAEEAAEPPFVLILDSLQDPQNFGALLRTAEAAGVHGVIIPLAHTAEVTPAVVNASAGAVEHLCIAPSNLAQSIDVLKGSDVWVVGLDPAGQPLDAGLDKYLGSGLALIVGSEGQGLRDLTRKKCDVLVQLPMRGQVASLNAAVSGSIALYLAYFARRGMVSSPSV